MHRIRITSAAIASSLALIAGGVSVAAHADEPVQDPCAKEQRQVEKAQAAHERAVAVFQAQENKADKKKAAKEKKAQKQRLAKAQERLAECQAEEAATAA